MFEHTHPFYDGNGRLGRFLMGLKLREILSVPTAMSLSRELSKDRQKYYKSFTVTEEPLNRGEATFFVIALLEMLSSAQESLLNSLERKKFALEKLEGRIQELRNGPGTSKEDRRLNILFIMGQAALFGPLLGLDLDTLATYLDK
ncbi:Fic family protein, partial [Bacillus toyonensis]